MLDGKENDLNSFGKLLRRLEIDNVAIPELRQLKQEHAYLEKLKMQRIKIEELKTKYDKAEQQLEIYSGDIQAQKQLIEEQHRTIQILEAKLEEAERKKNQLQTTAAKLVELEKEKLKNKFSDLLNEHEELKKESKAKDLIIFEMEDELQRQKQLVKEQTSFQRKKIIAEWEEKVRHILSDNTLKQKQNDELKELVTRQHKALQMQNEQFEESSQKNEELTEVVARLEEELSESIRSKQEAQERVTEVMELLQRMESELAQQRSGQSAKDQVEELRKKVNEMAKNEIEKIEFLVSQFD